MTSPLFHREANPAEAMLASGQWVKAGRSCYRHVTGAEVRKVPGGWQDSTQPQYVWSRLWVARDEVERRTAVRS